MTEKEFQEWLGPEIKTEFVENDFCEKHDGPTPSGGAYSIGYFYDKDGRPCRRENVAYMNIIEFSEDGTYINESLGAINHSEDS